MMNIVINGINGRMGKAVLEQAAGHPEIIIVGGIDPGAPTELSKLKISANPDEIVPDSDVVIDFSNPEGAVQILNACIKSGKPLVTGSTGLDAEAMKLYAEAANDIPIVQAFNFSIGINILMNLSQQVAALLQNSSDVEIIDIHHRNKKDSPSGTTVSLAKAIEAGKGTSQWQKGRSGTDLNREDEIGIHSLRGGSVIGEHQVHFFGENENLVLSHQALNRKIFVDGSFLAAKWLVGKSNGLFSMQDVLGFGKA